MILKSLTYIKAYLKEYIKVLVDSGELDADVIIKIEGIGREEKPDNEGIFITLLHIEEETSTKQATPTYTKYSTYEKPEIQVNLHVMLSAQHSNYETALRYISLVLQAFQSNTVIRTGEEDEDLRISLHPISLEHMTNLWQTLGAKLMPAVVYKVRMLTVQASKILTTKPILVTKVNRMAPVDPAAIKANRKAEEDRLKAEEENGPAYITRLKANDATVEQDFEAKKKEQEALLAAEITREAENQKIIDDAKREEVKKRLQSEYNHNK